MKFVVLGDTLVKKKLFGIQRFAIQILKQLDTMQFDFELEILIPNNTQIDYNFKKIIVKNYGYYKKPFIWRQKIFPKYVKENNAVGVDLCLGLPVKGKNIVCLHDCIYENYRDDFRGFKKSLKRLSYLFKVKRIIKKNRFFLTVSEFSKKELIEHYKLKSGQVIVINNSWEHMNCIDEDTSVLDRFSLKSNEFVFCLGSVLPHKNLKWIHEAAIQNKNDIFVITGNIFSYEKEFLDNVIYTGFLSDEEIKSLMKNCKLFVFPSLYEGFGIPPLEAVACGAKVALSNIPAVKEVFGEDYFYFDPKNYLKIDINQLSKVIEINQSVLEKYSWNEAACKLKNALSSYF